RGGVAEDFVEVFEEPCVGISRRKVQITHQFGQAGFELGVEFRGQAVHASTAAKGVLAGGETARWRRSPWPAATSKSWWGDNWVTHDPLREPSMYGKKAAGI